MLRSMLCGQRRSKIHFSDGSKFNLFGSNGETLCSSLNWGKTELKVWPISVHVRHCFRPYSEVRANLDPPKYVPSSCGANTPKSRNFRQYFYELWKWSSGTNAPLYSYMAEWMQMFIWTSCGSMRFLPCVHRPISEQFSCKSMSPSHRKKGKAVTWSWKHWNNEMASPEFLSKLDWESLENLWWQSYG